MEKFWNSIIKFASLAPIAILLYFGVALLTNSDKSVGIVPYTGAGLIFVGIVLAVFFFMDWRKREGYEHLIKQQDGLIKSLSAHINETSKTHTALEQQTRDSLNTTNERIKTKVPSYTPDANESTLDS